MPNYSGLNTLILSVNRILSWYLISSSSGFGAGGAWALGCVPGKTIAGKNVLTIFLKDFSSLSARS